jgi:hypothetical protein
MSYPSDIHVAYTLLDNTDDVLATHPNTLSSEIRALETKLGIDSSAVNTTVEYFLKHASGAYRTHTHDGSSDDGSLLDWDTCWSDAVHSHASAAEGGQVTLTTGITGILPVANGGTNSSSAANGANGVVILDGSGKFPVADGSQITNIGADWNKITTVTLSADSTKTISSSLVAGARYKLIISLVQNTSDGYTYLTFNNDSGNNYMYVASQFGSGTWTYNGDSVGRANIPLFYTVYTATVGYFQAYELLIQPAPTNTTTLMTGNGLYYGDVNLLFTTNNAGYYTGAATLSRIDIGTSSGTLSGTIVLYRLN